MVFYYSQELRNIRNQVVIEGLPKAQKRGQASELTQVYCKVSSEFLPSLLAGGWDFDVCW
jgi:hypothetical protein